MKKPLWLLSLLLPLAGTVAAQDSGDCPYLPADTGLSWEHRGGDNYDFCRALRADGTEAFGMNITKEAPFKPKGGNRAEHVTIDGREVTWYRAEIAGAQVEARETLVTMPDGRVAHIWVQAKSVEQLNQALHETESMKFQSARLSSN
jgi:hypothetical protein